MRIYEISCDGFCGDGGVLPTDSPGEGQKDSTPKAVIESTYGPNYIYLEIKPPSEISKEDAVGIIQEFVVKLNDLSLWAGLIGKIDEFFNSNGQKADTLSNLPNFYFKEMEKRARSNLPPSIDPVSNYFPGNYIYGILGNHTANKTEKILRIEDILLYLSSLPERPFGAYIVIEGDKEGEEAVEKAIRSLKDRYEAEIYGACAGTVVINRYTLLSGLAKIASKLPFARKYAKHLEDKARDKEALEKAAEYTARVLVEVADKYFS